MAIEKLADTIQHVSDQWAHAWLVSEILNSYVAIGFSVGLGAGVCFAIVAVVSCILPDKTEDPPK